METSVCQEQGCHLQLKTTTLITQREVCLGKKQMGEITEKQLLKYQR